LILRFDRTPSLIFRMSGRGCREPERQSSRWGALSRRSPAPIRPTPALFAYFYAKKRKNFRRNPENCTAESTDAHHFCGISFKIFSSDFRGLL